jgi:hypothetical protein
MPISGWSYSHFFALLCAGRLRWSIRCDSSVSCAERIRSSEWRMAVVFSRDGDQGTPYKLVHQRYHSCIGGRRGLGRNVVWRDLQFTRNSVSPPAMSTIYKDLFEYQILMSSASGNVHKKYFGLAQAWGSENREEGPVVNPSRSPGSLKFCRLLTISSPYFASHRIQPAILWFTWWRSNEHMPPKWTQGVFKDSLKHAWHGLLVVRNQVTIIFFYPHYIQ